MADTTHRGDSMIARLVRARKRSRGRSISESFQPDRTSDCLVDGQLATLGKQALETLGVQLLTQCR